MTAMQSPTLHERSIIIISDCNLGHSSQWNNYDIIPTQYIHTIDFVNICYSCPLCSIRKSLYLCHILTSSRLNGPWTTSQNQLLIYKTENHIRTLQERKQELPTTNIIRKGKTTNKANIPKQFPRHVWYTRGVKQNKLMHEISIL